MSKRPDADDRQSPTWHLRYPRRTSVLRTSGARDILIEELHAYLWLSLKRAEHVRGNSAEDRRMVEQVDRLLGSWLQHAEFAEGAIH